MKSQLLLLSLLLTALPATVPAQNISMSFQGRLGGHVATNQGRYDLVFTVYDQEIGGRPTSASITNLATLVSNRLFAATLDLNLDTFTNDAAWLEISLRPAASGTNFTALEPRQSLISVQQVPAPEGKATDSPQAKSNPPRSGNQSLRQTKEKQAEVVKAARNSLAKQKSVSKSGMQKAAQSLQNANNTLGPLTSGALGQLPQGAQSQLQEAQAESGEGSAEASEGKNGEAQQSASAAAQALAKAQAALSLAQAGVGSQAAMKPGEGKQPGQQPGKGQGKGQGQGKGEAKGQAKGKGQPNPQGDGREGNFEGSGGADGQRNGTAGSSAFTKLPARDRAALQQSQADKYPQEYGPLVEQYLRNLSDQSGQK